jgi:hypothetical protein
MKTQHTSARLWCALTLLLTLGFVCGSAVRLTAQSTTSTRTNGSVLRAAERSVNDIATPLVYDPVYAGFSLGYLGGQFLRERMCNEDGQSSFINQVSGVAQGLIFGGVGGATGIIARVGITLFNLSRFAGTGIVGAITGSAPPPPPSLEELILLNVPSLALAGYTSLQTQFLGNGAANGLFEPSVAQMSPPGVALPAGNVPSLLGTLNTAASTTPRAGIYGTSAFQSPIRLFSNSLGRAVNPAFSQITLGAPGLGLGCEITYPKQPIFPGFLEDIPERQEFRNPNDQKLVTYINRLRDIYRVGAWTNYSLSLPLAPFNFVADVFDIGPTSIEVGDAWERGARQFEVELQNNYSLLIGAYRTVSATQRQIHAGYRCPGSTTLLPEPDGPDCTFVVQEVDVPISYLVSTGDDGFIAENDQKIPLRDAAVRSRFEQNYRAGLNSSCHHFTEGNHPEVYQALQFMLTQNDESPFFIPRR